MSFISTIRNHSERLFAGIQMLMGVAIASAMAALFLQQDAGLALTICVASIAAGAAGLFYLRRSIALRLRHASKLEAEKQRILEVDPLTGILSRRHFLDELNRMLGSPIKCRPCVLLLVDVDHFKQLNDSYGHLFGDRALASIGKALAKVFPEAVIGRLGGDEFAVAIGGSDLEAARRRAGRVLRQLGEGIAHEGNTIALSASIGIAATPRHADQSNELMLLADLAMYESKASGRGRATVFNPEMTADRRHRRLVERELRAAIYLNELEVHYQPIVDADGTTQALEALVRWRHTVRGLIPPSEFIPVAERSRLIDIVGEWVFKRVCADLPGLPEVRVSINISGEQLRRDEVVSMCERVLLQTGAPANRFILEITETVAMSASAEELRRLETLRDMGFSIALDDFGTGHCGFNYLKTLPIACIKIDRSYIRALGTDPVAEVFVTALTHIGRIQDLMIVAEGIETVAEFGRARAAGCRRFQGYHFARPEPLGAGIPAKLPAPRRDMAQAAA